MKKLILSLSLLLMSLGTMASTSASDFLLDEQSFQEEMSTLNQIEEELLNPNLNSSASGNTALFARHGLQQSAFGMDEMEWGPFAWGFCCWPVGFFVVAINSNKSKNEKLSFWIGTGVSIVLSAISGQNAIANN